MSRTYPVRCCECSEYIAETSCEITATSHTMCESCHADYLAEIESHQD